MTLDELPTPALLLDLDVLERNLATMAARCRELGVRLRPHLKTHKCAEVAALQRTNGATGATVATLDEARAFAAAGAEDLTWAFPVVPSRIREVVALAERIILRVVVDAPEAVALLEETGRPLHVWLKVDCGYHRAGVDASSPRSAELARRLAGSSTLLFDGLLSHSGHSYKRGSPAEVEAAGEEERAVVTAFAERLRSAGIEVPAVSTGSTPAMSQIRGLAGVDEVRPGNYAFYDFTQVCLGSCAIADCALTVLATVVSSQPGAGHAVVDAGALALSLDPGRLTPTPTFGELFRDPTTPELSGDLRLVSLSQEHGVLNRGLPWGTRVRILPNHSCLLPPLFEAYTVVRGQQIIDRWPVLGRRD